MNSPKLSLSRRRMLAALTAMAALPIRVSAQSRPVRLIVASSAGSTIDVIARSVQSALASALGAPLVVEDIAGAGSVIAMQTLARSAPDGSVLALQTNNMVIAPLLIRPAPYDASKDFTAIAIVGTIPLAVVVNASRVAAKDPKEFIALLKSKGDTLNYGSSGNGTILHLAVELIEDEIGVRVTHVPYKGVAPMVTDLVGGRIDFVVTSLPAVDAFVKSGKLRIVGMLTPERVAIAPEVPTFAEQGFPKSIAEVWFAVLGPKGLTPTVVKKVHDALLVTFDNPAVREVLEKQGNTIKVSTPEEAQAVIRQDVLKYSELAKKINLTPQ